MDTFYGSPGVIKS